MLKKKNKTAGIAGAGLLGRLLALKLQQSHWKVSLFDQDDMNGTLSCGLSAAGMLAPMSELESSDTSIYELGLRSLTLWPTIIKHLPHPVYFQQAGSLITAHPQDRNELHRYSQLIASKLSQKTHEILDEKAVQTLEPELKNISEGIYFPIEGQIANQELMKALAITLTRTDVQWFPKTKVTHVDPRVIYFENGKQTFDMVFDCRGLGAKSTFSDLRGIRGELIELHAPAVNITRPVRLLHPRYRLYIVPRPHHHYVIGSSEIESEDSSNISVRSTLEFLTAAYSLHTGFAEARIIKTTVNCRPTFPDHLPRIKQEAGLIAINGLYRHGLLIAPALLEKAEVFYA